jgi:hypothetical protein
LVRVVELSMSTAKIVRWWGRPVAGRGSVKGP